MTRPDPKQIAQEIADELMGSRGSYMEIQTPMGKFADSFSDTTLVEKLTDILNRRLKK